MNKARNKTDNSSQTNNKILKWNANKWCKICVEGQIKLKWRKR